ncbi:MAG: hypothetical protein PW786_10275 [Arachidicoccus sp.]|nr:hypothetical protein [Arachidicoccus sp.]
MNKNDKTRFDFYLSTNLCFVYCLKSGEVVLLPNERADTSKGILFSEKKYFDECVENDSFPIENEGKGMQQRYQDEIKTINTQTDKMFYELSSKLSPKEILDVNNISSLSKLLDLTKKKWKKLTTQEQFYATLLLGEYVRRTYKGRWLLIKKYGTFNPYYEPTILYPDSSIFELGRYLNLYFNHSVTPEIYVTLPLIADQGMKLSSINPSMYKILE